MQFGGLDANVRGPALTPQHIPSVMELHRRVSDMSLELHQHFRLELPEVNGVPILSRYVRAFMLPPTFYVATKALLTLLRIDMHVRGVAVIPPNAAGRARSREDAEQGKAWLASTLAFSRNTHVPRCVMLMAALIVTIKLRYGLDGIERHDAHGTAHGRSATAGAPRQSDWLDALDALHADAPFEPWDTSRDVLAMPDVDMDTYLAFVEDMYMPKNIPASLPLRRRDDVDDLIPCARDEVPKHKAVDWGAYVKGVETQDAERRRRAVQALYATRPTYGSSSIAPGEAFAVYAHDPGGAMPRDLLRVIDAGKRIVGLDMHGLPPYRPSNVAWHRPHDQDVLLDCVMQLEEALLTTLRRPSRRAVS